MGGAALGVGVPTAEPWPEDPTGDPYLCSEVGIDAPITYFHDPKETSAMMLGRPRDTDDNKDT